MYNPSEYAAAVIALERSAQQHANSTWFWGILAGLLWYFWTVWGAAIPGVFAVACAYSSMSCTLKATKLRRLLAPPDING